MPLLHSRLLVHSMSTISGKYAFMVDLLRLCSCKEFFVSEMASLIVLLKNKGIILKILLKRTRGLLGKENPFWNFNIWSILNDSV
jgi:hypothetical protein